MKKKILLSGLVAVGLVTNSFAADITYYGLNDGYSKINSMNFYDVASLGDGYWANPAIYEIASLGIMNGVANNYFSPTTSVTNEQAVTTILNAKGKGKDVENIKMVVKNWSDKYIKYAMNDGLITEKIVYKKADVTGDVEVFKDKGVFIRDLPITREEVATLIYRAFKLPTTSNTDEARKPIEFLDKALIDSNRLAHVEAISLAGIMVGDESGMFNPKSNLTRAEFAQIFKNCEDYLLNDLRLTKHSAFIDSANGSSFELTDAAGNTIEVNCANRDIPVIRNNKLFGIASLRASDEIEFFVDTSKQVVFIRVIDEGIYENNSSNNVSETISKQGIVTGNSPYFYEISIKDKNGNVENYKYGSWTTVYKDGKETSPSSILLGDTVYLEFDEIGDLVVIRGVTNAVINYGTIIGIDKYDVKIKMDKDNSVKQFNLKRIPIYENGMEIDALDLYNGKYVKLYISQSELIKVEIVLDERTAENLYTGYISEVNLIQGRIILRNPKILKEDKWETIGLNFITLSLDDEMKVTFDGEDIEKQELGEKQIEKFAYIVTRQDTKVLEKVKAINIEFDNYDDTIVGEVRSYNKDSGLLKLYDDSRKLYIDDSTICVDEGKIVSPSSIEKLDKALITLAYSDNKYFVKFIKTMERIEEREVEVYYGKINEVDSGEEVAIEVLGRFDDDKWNKISNRYASFSITDTTRIFDETGPLTFKEFDNSYETRKAIIIASGDEIVSVGTIDFGQIDPYISIGSIKEVTGTDFLISDVEKYDHQNNEWIEIDRDERIKFSVGTLITRAGNFARSSEVKKGQEVVVIRLNENAAAGAIFIRE